MSVTYGRPAIVSNALALAVIDSCSKDVDCENVAPSIQYLTKKVELFEIIHHAAPLLYDQHSSSSSFAERVGLPSSKENRELHETALHFDSCLSKWEQDLPLHLKYGAAPDSIDEMYQRQAVALRLRSVEIHTSPRLPLMKMRPSTY